MSGDAVFLWQICRDFLVGKCNRTSCKYVHSVEAKIADMKQRSDATTDVCKDFLNGRCNRAVCRYQHPTSTLDDRSTQALSTVATAAPETSVCVVFAWNTVVCFDTLSIDSCE